MCGACTQSLFLFISIYLSLSLASSELTKKILIIRKENILPYSVPFVISSFFDGTHTNTPAMLVSVATFCNSKEIQRFTKAGRHFK